MLIGLHAVVVGSGASAVRGDSFLFAPLASASHWLGNATAFFAHVGLMANATGVVTNNKTTAVINAITAATRFTPALDSVFTVFPEVLLAIRPYRNLSLIS